VGANLRPAGKFRLYGRHIFPELVHEEAPPPGFLGVRPPGASSGEKRGADPPLPRAPGAPLPAGKKAKKKKGAKNGPGAFFVSKKKNTGFRCRWFFRRAQPKLGRGKKKKKNHGGGRGGGQNRTLNPPGRGAPRRGRGVPASPPPKRGPFSHLAPQVGRVFVFFFLPNHALPLSLGTAGPGDFMKQGRGCPGCPQTEDLKSGGTGGGPSLGAHSPGKKKKTRDGGGGGVGRFPQGCKNKKRGRQVFKGRKILAGPRFFFWRLAKKKIWFLSSGGGRPGLPHFCTPMSFGRGGTLPKRGSKGGKKFSGLKQSKTGRRHFWGPRGARGRKGLKSSTNGPIFPGGRIKKREKGIFFLAPLGLSSPGAPPPPKKGAGCSQCYGDQKGFSFPIKGPKKKGEGRGWGPKK